MAAETLVLRLLRLSCQPLKLATPTVDDRPAYVFAGYPAEMKNFRNVNAGLARRITDTFYFNDYTETELCQIFLVMVKKGGFQINIENQELLLGTTFGLLGTTFYAGLCTKLFCNYRERNNQRVVNQLLAGVSKTQVHSSLNVIISEDIEYASTKLKSQLL